MQLGEAVIRSLRLMGEMAAVNRDRTASSQKLRSSRIGTESCDLLTASLTRNVDGYAYLVSDARPAEACGKGAGAFAVQPRSI